MNNEENTAISYNIEEISHSNDISKNTLDNLINSLENAKKITEQDSNNLNIFLNEYQDSYILNNYELYQKYDKYTLKELYLICDYYGFAKDLKKLKLNKLEIINYLIEFECDYINCEIVFKRQNLWFYMNELKNDKFMKKYIIC